MSKTYKLFSYFHIVLLASRSLIILCPGSTANLYTDKPPVSLPLNLCLPVKHTLKHTTPTHTSTTSHSPPSAISGQSRSEVFIFSHPITKLLIPAGPERHSECEHPPTPHPGGPLQHLNQQHNSHSPDILTSFITSPLPRQQHHHGRMGTALSKQVKNISVTLWLHFHLWDFPVRTKLIITLLLELTP